MFDRLLQDLLQAVDVKISGSIDRDNQEVRRVAVHRRPRQVAHQDIRNDLRLEVDDEHLQGVRNLVDNSDELKLSLDLAGQCVERKRFEAVGRKLAANDDTQLPAERFRAKDLVSLFEEGVVGLLDEMQPKTEKTGAEDNLEELLTLECDLRQTHLLALLQINKKTLEGYKTLGIFSKNITKISVKKIARLALGTQVSASSHRE